MRELEGGCIAYFIGYCWQATITSPHANDLSPLLSMLSRVPQSRTHPIPVLPCLSAGPHALLAVTLRGYLHQFEPSLPSSLGPHCASLPCPHAYLHVAAPLRAVNLHPPSPNSFQASALFAHAFQASRKLCTFQGTNLRVYSAFTTCQSTPSAMLGLTLDIPPPSIQPCPCPLAIPCRLTSVAYYYSSACCPAQYCAPGNLRQVELIPLSSASFPPTFCPFPQNNL